jgi:hypothetical protein
MFIKHLLCLLNNPHVFFQIDLETVSCETLSLSLIVALRAATMVFANMDYLPRHLRRRFAMGSSLSTLKRCLCVLLALVTFKLLAAPSSYVQRSSDGILENPYGDEGKDIRIYGKTS